MQNPLRSSFLVERRKERSRVFVKTLSSKAHPSISDDQNQPTAEEERKSGKEFQRPSFLDTIEPHSISREIIPRIWTTKRGTIKEDTQSVAVD